VKPSELIDLLREFYRDKLALRNRHEAGARLVGAYEVNNTYQYILAREDVQLDWIRAAVLDLEGLVSEDESGIALAPAGKPGERMRRILEEDAREAQAFVDRWRPRLETMTHARHQGMLRVVLGETLEHKRFFEQALAGRADLLGRRADGAGTGGGVLPMRWLE
jgi:hypothetical protein